MIADSLYISWNVLFVFVFFILFSFILLRPALLLYSIFNSNPSLRGNTVGLNFHQLFSFLVLWFSQLILITLVWNSPEFFVLSNHIRFTNNSLNSLTYLFFSYFVTLSVLIFKGNSLLTNFKGFFYTFNVSFVFTMTYLLTLTSTLYSFVFILEILNLMVLGTLLTSLLNFFNYKGRNLPINYSSTVNSFVTFFWINALSSILLFVFLIASAVQNGTEVYDLTQTLNGLSLGLFNLSDLSFFVLNLDAGSLNAAVAALLSTYSDPSFFVTVLFLFVFFFKIGLPPFIFWKVLVFDSAPISFIYNYNLPYFFLLLIYTLYLLTVILSLGLNLCYYYLYIYLTLAILAVIIIAERTTSLGSFFAISSSLTSIFVFVLYILTLETGALGLTNPVIVKSTVLYLIFYAITLLLLFSIIFTLKIKSGSFKISSLTTNLLKPHRVTGLLRINLFVILSSFAGIPPLSSFFTKLLLLTNLNNSATLPMQLVILIVLIYLLATLVFYFKFVKDLFTKNLVNSCKYARVTCKSNPLMGLNRAEMSLNLTHFSNFISSLLLLGFFFISDLLIYLHI